MEQLHEGNHTQYIMFVKQERDHEEHSRFWYTALLHWIRRPYFPSATPQHRISKGTTYICDREVHLDCIANSPNIYNQLVIWMDEALLYERMRVRYLGENILKCRLDLQRSISKCIFRLFH